MISFLSASGFSIWLICRLPQCYRFIGVFLRLLMLRQAALCITLVIVGLYLIRKLSVKCCKLQLVVPRKRLYLKLNRLSVLGMFLGA